MIPPWARAKMLRAAYMAGVVAGYQHSTPDEVKRSVRVTLGETGAMPSVRDAFKNRPISGTRYADVSAWGISLVHTGANEQRTFYETRTRELLDPRQSVPWLLDRLRRGSLFYGEALVRDRVGINGRLLAEMADEVIAQIDAINAAAQMPLETINLTIAGTPK